MKFLKNIIAVLMALIIGLSVSVYVFASTTESQLSRPQYLSISEYKQKLYDEGIPVFTTKQFLTIANIFNPVIRFLTGKWLVPDNNMDVTVDEFVTSACDYVFENCGLDIVAILTNIPDVNGFAEFTTEVFQIDTVAMRETLYDKRDQYWEEGNTLLSSLCDFLGAYMSVIEKCEVCAVETDNPVVLEVVLRFTFKDGGTETLKPGILINTETGECTNRNNSGLVKTGFNFSLADMMVYATIDAWMRDFGFCVLYDIAANSAPLLWNYNTRRFCFEYQGLEWMIQMWKGNYLITNGGEVGLYNRNSDEKIGTFYECATDDQLLEMSLEIYHGEDLLVCQEPQMHWWINGFNMSDRIYIPSSLTLKSSIVMRDEEMLNAFCEAIDKHYRKDVTYTVEGLKVNIVW